MFGALYVSLINVEVQSSIPTNKNLRSKIKLEKKNERWENIIKVEHI